MTKDLKPENQAEAEALAREFLERICDSDPPNFNRLMEPELLSVEHEQCSLTLAYRFSPWMRNQLGNMHGGVIGAAGDIAMGVVTYVYSGKKMPPTVSQQTSYLRPVPDTGRLIVRATADKAGRTAAFLRCMMWMEGSPEEPVATATGVYSTAGKTYDELLKRKK